MDNYQRLDCVKGLLMGMDKQLNDLFQKDNLPENVKTIIVNKYFEAAQELLDEGETVQEKILAGLGKVKIVVNGKKWLVPEKSISYKELVQLAGFDKNNLALTITYNSNTYSGKVCYDEFVKLNNSMVFNVVDTGDNNES